MTIKCELRYRGIESDNGDKPFRKYGYLISGTDDEEAALSALANETPETRVFERSGTQVTFKRSGIKISEYAPNVNPGAFFWEGEATYTPQNTHFMHTGPDYPETAFSISCGSTNAVVKTAIEQTRYGSNTPAVGNAINVVESDGKLDVQGASILVPVATLKAEKIYPMNRWAGLVGGCIHAVGCTNNAPFSAGPGLSFSAEELLFAGVEISPEGDDMIRASYQFLISPGSKGAIDGINYEKQGWRYLWAFYRDVVSDNAMAKKATSIYIARVYPSVSFSNIMG